MKHISLIAFFSFSVSLNAQPGGVGISSKPYQHLTPQAPRLVPDSTRTEIAPMPSQEVIEEMDEETLRAMKCARNRTDMVDGKEELRMRIRQRVIKELGRKILKYAPVVDARIGVGDDGGILGVSVNTAVAYGALIPIVEDEIRKLTWEPVECEGRLRGHQVRVHMIL